MSKSWNILVAESKDFAPEAKQALTSLGRVTWGDLGSDGLREQLNDKEILWVRLRSHIDGSILDSAPKLRIIASPTTGLTHIDLGEVEARKIQVVSLKGEHEFLRKIRATAEFTIGLILSLLRHIPASVEHVREGGWNRDLFRGTELFGRTVGVVGYGRLGQIVTRYLNAFESTVLVADPNVTADAVERPARLVSLEELLEQSDVVTIHADLNPSSTGLFGAEQIQLMKPGSYLVNTSRGEIVNEAALLEALASGHLGGAAVDVIAREHEYRTSPVIEWARSHENLIVTPHTGGCTLESMTRTETFLAAKVCDAAMAMGAGE